MSAPPKALLFGSDAYAHAATTFADKYHRFSPARAGNTMIRECLELAKN